MLIMRNNKRDRISKLFIEIAKDMIIREGVLSVSVRKIADEAGYSYATIYNYFDDLNSLLWAVKKDMIQDLIIWMDEQHSSDLVGIKHLFHRYIEYYITNPNIFRFFYFYSLEVPIEELEQEFNFSLMWNATFSGVMEEYNLSLSDLEIISKTLIYSIHGILTLHFSQNGNLNMNIICSDIDKIIDYLINRKGDL